MDIVTRGFSGRRRDTSRQLPPGQYLTNDFPVLSAGPTPRIPLDAWAFTITTELAESQQWSWAELANRGIKDVLIVCCDGLTGFPEAIEATWPNSTIQTCVVHLIRAAMRFVNW